MRILDYDPLTGLTMTFEYHHDTDKFSIGYFQSNMDRIIEDNKRAVIELDHKKQAKKGWSLYARVPTWIQLEWAHKHGVEFWNYEHWRDGSVMKLINSPDYAPAVKRTSYYHDR